MAPKCIDKAKITHKFLNLQDKLELIKLSEKGMSMTDTGRKLGVPRSTVNTIVKNKAKLLDEIKNATPVLTEVIRKRDSLIANLEKLLNVWIHDQISQNIPLSTGIIQAKALNLFNTMKTERG
jgi:IS30 family transposase